MLKGFIAVPSSYTRYLAAMALALFATQSVAEQLTLPQFVTLVIQNSDTSASIRDDLAFSRLNLNSELQNYDFQYTPRSAVSVNSEQDTTTFGFGVGRETTWGPEFGLDVGYSNSADNQNSFNRTSSFTVSQGLLRRWGTKYSRRNLTIAEISALKSKMQSDRDYQALVLDAAGRYFDVVLAELRLAQGEQAFRRSQENVKVAQARQKIGLTSKVDEFRAELSLLNAEDALRLQRRNFISTKRRLKEFAGVEDGSDFEVIPDIPPLQMEYPHGWFDWVWDSRLEWLIFEQTKRAQELNLYVAEKNLLPDLNAFVRVTNQELDRTLQTVADETSWELGLSVSSSIDVFEERTALSKARISYQALLREEQALRRSIINDIEEAIAEVDSERRRARIVEAKLLQAKQALELTTLRYNRGLSSNLEQIESEEALSAAELDTIEQKIGYNRKVLDLAFKLGILNQNWLFKKMENTKH